MVMRARARATLTGSTAVVMAARALSRASGVAVSSNPAGPFKADPEPLEGAFSIDPAVFRDSDGSAYLYFGGIWGGQLQRWATGTQPVSRALRASRR